MLKIINREKIKLVYRACIFESILKYIEIRYITSNECHFFTFLSLSVILRRKYSKDSISFDAILDCLLSIQFDSVTLFIECIHGNEYSLAIWQA